MGYVQVEEVTLPTRFLLKTGHLVTFLALAFDIDAVVANMIGSMGDFDSVKSRVQGLAYAAFACFAIEYSTLFLGATTFLRGITALNILAHGVGIILMILLQIDHWSLKSLIAFFTVFNATPAALELACLLFTSRSVFIAY